MYKQPIIILFIVVLVTVELSGCTQNDSTENPEKNKFIGTWVTTDDAARVTLGKTLVFYSNGTVTSELPFTGTFEIAEGNYLRIYITINGNQTQHLFDYELSNNGNTLRLLYQNTGRMYLYTRE